MIWDGNVDHLDAPIIACWWIINCVVYSTACKQCAINEKKNNTTVGDDDPFWIS